MRRMDDADGDETSLPLGKRDVTYAADPRASAARLLHQLRPAAGAWQREPRRELLSVRHQKVVPGKACYSRWSDEGCCFERLPEFRHAVFLVIERQADDAVVGVVDVDGVRDSVLFDGEQEVFLPLVGFEQVRALRLHIDLLLFVRLILIAEEEEVVRFESLAGCKEVDGEWSKPFVAHQVDLVVALLEVIDNRREVL